MDTLQFLTERVKLLEFKLDSIQHANNIAELSMKVNEQANIVSNVNSFYESAWLKLIIVISILGIIIPLLIQYFQRNSLKQVIDFLSKEIKEAFEIKIAEIEESNLNQINKLSEKVTQGLNNLDINYNYLSNEIEGSLFYFQGKQHMALNKYDLGLKDFIKSTKSWLKSSKPERYTVPLSYVESCILSLKTKTLFNLAIEEIDWKSFLDLLDEKPMYKDSLIAIKKAVKNLK